MSGTEGHDDETLTYAVRFTERAQRDLDAATIQFAESVSPEFAIEWREGLYDLLASLARFPRRCSSAPEKFRRDVRQILYQRSGSRTIYRILFAIAGEEVTSLDAPHVTILHIRHASTRPITRPQARAIEEEQ